MVAPGDRSAWLAASAAPGERLAHYRWPVTPPIVVRRFDPPRERWLPGHRGVDLAVPPATVVRAAGAGTVVFAGVVAGRGVLSVAHAGGLRTTYEPVTTTVARGDRVAAGDPLGTIEIGHPRCPKPTCLHWGLRRGTDYLDPLALLGLGRVRLLPLTARYPSPPATF
nr:M23 family metallopeptidase [Actinoplanes sp. DH11]